MGWMGRAFIDLIAFTSRNGEPVGASAGGTAGRSLIPGSRGRQRNEGRLDVGADGQLMVSTPRRGLNEPRLSTFLRYTAIVAGMVFLSRLLRDIAKGNPPPSALRLIPASGKILLGS